MTTKDLLRLKASSTTHWMHSTVQSVTRLSPTILISKIDLIKETPLLSLLRIKPAIHMQNSEQQLAYQCPENVKM